MEKPLISVIVPVYNVEKFLDRCLESLVSQTYENLQILLIDDGSTDHSPEICKKWSAADARIQYKRIQNRGAAAARNAALEMASGDYLMFADSDDTVEKDIVEYLLKLVCENDADVARCSFFVEEHSTSNIIPAEDKILCDRDAQTIDLILNGYISGVLWNKIYKTDVVKNVRFPEDYESSEDLVFNYNVLKNVNKIVCSSKPLYHYFVRENSITQSAFGYGAFDVIRAKKMILESQKNNAKVYPYAVRGYITSAFVVLTGCISHNKCMDRYDELRDSVLLHKKTILKSNEYTFVEKLKVVVLSISPKLYNKVMAKRA